MDNSNLYNNEIKKQQWQINTNKKELCFNSLVSNQSGHSLKKT